MGVERICPALGEVCPAQEILKNADRHIDRDAQRRLKSLAQSVGVISRRGTCEGVLVTDELLGTAARCSNSELPAMQDVYRSAREDQTLKEVLPESLAVVTRNE